MSGLIACIPNFSEGRRPEVIGAILDAIRAPDVHILDSSSDPDHHRTVVTFVGEAQPVMEAMLRGAAVAVAHIDLETHQGEHPRLGAVDVVPFVPLRETTLDDCAMLAQAFGARAAETLNIPVYLYEAAATRTDRINLADVRRGGYENLKITITADPARAPDFGEAQVGRAGAIIVGARKPLIAFNAFLDIDDVEIAHAVARAIRERDGGLPFLKALGMRVQGRTQVSMNIVDYRQTGLYTIMQAVRREAAARGAIVTHTELVGLIPQQALIQYALESLGLPSETRAQTFEARIGIITGDYRPLFE